MTKTTKNFILGILNRMLNRKYALRDGSIRKRNTYGDLIAEAALKDIRRIENAIREITAVNESEG